jgi:hypothetical protein
VKALVLLLGLAVVACAVRPAIMPGGWGKVHAPVPGHPAPEHPSGWMKT